MTQGVDATEPIDWDSIADLFCRAWSAESDKPDFQTLSTMYAPEPEVVIYDSLPPLNGFRGFADLKSTIYPDLRRLSVKRISPVEWRSFADDRVVIVAYLLRYEYGFRDGRELRFDGRISQLWERRGDRFVIVHEHPSTVLTNGAEAHHDNARP